MEGISVYEIPSRRYLVGLGFAELENPISELGRPRSLGKFTLKFHGTASIPFIDRSTACWFGTTCAAWIKLGAAAD